MVSMEHQGGRQQLGDEAAAHLRELIISGQLRPGEFIRLDRLAAELNMSVTPVRLALVTLRGEGFVRQEPNRGFVVSDLREEDILDLFTVQAFVAGELAAHAARSIDAIQISRLTKILAAIEVATESKSLTDAEASAHEFHEVVIEVARRPKLAWLLQISERYQPRNLYSDLEGWKRLSVREHRAILKALKAHDPGAAREAMRSHVEHLGRLVALNFLERSGRTGDGVPA